MNRLRPINEKLNDQSNEKMYQINKYYSKMTNHEEDEKQIEHLMNKIMDIQIDTPKKQYITYPSKYHFEKNNSNSNQNQNMNNSPKIVKNIVQNTSVKTQNDFEKSKLRSLTPDFVKELYLKKKIYWNQNSQRGLPSIEIRKINRDQSNTRFNKNYNQKGFNNEKYKSQLNKHDNQDEGLNQNKNKVIKINIHMENKSSPVQNNNLKYKETDLNGW